MNNSLSNIPTNLMPIMDMPRNAPDMPVAMLKPTANISELFPSNYFSMEDLDEELKAMESEALILTVEGVSYELVHDPTDKPTSDDWKVCLRFKERSQMLVMGKNRAKAFAHIVGSRVVAHWAEATEKRDIQIALHVGRIQAKEQLCISPDYKFLPQGNGKVINEDMPANDKPKKNGKSALELTNEELFG